MIMITLYHYHFVAEETEADADDKEEVAGIRLYCACKDIFTACIL